jgi:hypothetical protein
MAATTIGGPISAGTFLRLGRVSNLPTIWTNVLAATAIAGGDLMNSRTAIVLLAMTLFYIGGMYLNDAFDREIDTRQRPTRPIPAGEIAPLPVFVIGFGLLVTGLALMTMFGAAAFVSAFVLAAMIVLYDVSHKGSPFSPVLMGVCRLLVYVGAALAAVGFVPSAVWIAGVAMAAHVLGLTCAAKQEPTHRIEQLWPLAFLMLPLLLSIPAIISTAWALLFWIVLAGVDLRALHTLRQRAVPDSISSAVGTTIAAISLVDAVFAVPYSLPIALFACVAYVATRFAQHFIAGT